MFMDRTIQVLVKYPAVVNCLCHWISQEAGTMEQVWRIVNTVPNTYGMVCLSTGRTYYIVCSMEHF